MKEQVWVGCIVAIAVGVIMMLAGLNAVFLYGFEAGYSVAQFGGFLLCAGIFRLLLE